MSKDENKTCFVIAPIGEANSEVRKRSDQVLRHIIQPSASVCGYEAIRADQISEPGIITSQIIQHVVNDPMVIADLTGRNPNVFYELAIRHAVKKPLVQIIKKDEQIPFDVAATRTVEVDIHDLDSVEGAKAEIIRQMKSLQEGVAEVDSPISVALDLQVLRESGKPEERQLADVLDAINEIRSDLASVKKRLNDMADVPLLPRRRLVPKEEVQALLDALQKKPADLREIIEEELPLSLQIRQLEGAQAR